MIFRKVSLLATFLLIVFFGGCDQTKSVLHPVDTIAPFSPEMNHTLMEQWRVTSIDGDAISESLSRLQTLVAEYVSEDINISFYGTVTNPIFRLNADGTWKLSVYYNLFCDRNPEQSSLEPVDPIENSSLVFIRLSVGGTYIAFFDTEKQSNVLFFETEKHTQGTIYHENPYTENYTCPADGFGCPALKFYPAFTADLDWSIFDENPLSHLFSSVLLDTQIDTPVVYTWDMVTSEGTREDYNTERGWGAGSDILSEGFPLVRWTFRLYSQGQEDIVLRRTGERTDL